MLQEQVKVEQLSGSIYAGCKIIAADIVTTYSNAILNELKARHKISSSWLFYGVA